jgi:formylglycine-generating enzyme
MRISPKLSLASAFEPRLTSYASRVKPRGLVVGLAIAGSLGGAWACGARTGIGVVDEVGNDGGGENGATSRDSGCDPPSCAQGGPGLTNCGTTSECCCTSLAVSGRTFFRTYTNLGSGSTGEADPATVSDFHLDKYLVTVGRFRQFVNAWDGGAGYTPPAGSGKHEYLNGGLGLANSESPGTYEPGWLESNATYIAPTNANLGCDPSYATWTPSVGSHENLPMNCVNAYEAYAFCIWDGGFLPSEAEWEYAAAGGSQQREYPWGSTDPGTNNQYAIYGDGVPSPQGCYYPSGEVCSGVVNIAPVGTAIRGAGRWSQLDMAGDVAEWTLDGYGTYVDPCIDCAYLLASNPYTSRVARGGAFDLTNLFPWNRNFGPPTARVSYYGLRCARTP